MASSALVSGAEVAFFSLTSNHLNVISFFKFHFSHNNMGAYLYLAVVGVIIFKI